MKNIFKRKKRYRFEVYGQKVIQSAEDKNTCYWEFPDGLRLRFQDRKYVGWYVTEAK